MATIEESLLVKTRKLDTSVSTNENSELSITHEQPIRREISHGVNATPPKPNMASAKKTLINSMAEDVQSDEHLEVNSTVNINVHWSIRHDIIFFFLSHRVDFAILCYVSK